jgi:ankyrin repeat protein
LYNRTRSTETARVLIEHGASVELKDDMGRTPLDIASGEQREEIIKLLEHVLSEVTLCHVVRSNIRSAPVILRGFYLARQAPVCDATTNSSR